MVGTLRHNRKPNPTVVIRKKLKRGEVSWLRHKSVLITKWNDKKDVYMTSTMHNHQICDGTSKSGKKMVKHICLADYNEFMGGVDRSDLLTS